MLLKKTSLFDKLFILHIFSTTLLFLIIIVSYSYIGKNTFNENLIKKFVLVHDFLEISCVDPIVGTIAYDRTYRAIEALYRKNNEIVYIEIYDPTALIIASIGELPGVHLGVEEINLLFNQGSNSGQQTNINQDRNELITYLKAGDRDIGLIRIGFTKKYLKKELRGNIMYFLGLFIIAIAITSLIFYLFTNKWIVQPIVTVSKIMNSYGQAELPFLFTDIKNYNKSIAKDEIGIMSTAFERMLASIITRTKEKEKAEERYRLIAENVGDVIWTMDLAFRFIYISPSIYQLSGYTFQETMGHSLEDLFLPDSLEKVKDIFKRTFTLIESGDEEGFQPVEFEAEHLCKDGTIIWTSNNARVLPGPENQAAKIVGITRDITQRKRAEEALRASHERFLTVLNSIDATIYVADMETYEIIFMNKYMIESFARDMTGETCWEVFRGESGPCPGCTNNQLIDKNGNPTGVLVWQDKNPIIGKWYMNYDRAIEWTDGRLVKLQIATDITELKKMEEELIQAHKMESIGTLAGGVAHDFNNILYMIIGNAELALEDIPKLHPSHSKLESIKYASLKAAGIVKQLLSFSRKIDHELKPMDIVSTIEDSLEFLRATIPTTIEIRRQLPDKEMIILADLIQINQIVMNLCINAFQAMEETGGILEIKVDTTAIEKGSVKDFPDLVPGQYVKIVMIDTGLGMNPEIIDRIFDPYFTTKEIGKGSGMGLAVVHGIVKSHGGAISVDSKLGKGTTFTILFPIFDKKPEKQIETNYEPGQGIGTMGTETILFVDDEEFIIDMSVQMLEQLGYKVRATANPWEAFELFQSKPREFDIVITDMTMPGMTGVQLSEKLKEVRSDIPVIICTGHSSFIDEETAEKLGIAAYLMKPVLMSEITKTIRMIMDK